MAEGFSASFWNRNRRKLSRIVGALYWASFGYLRVQGPIINGSVLIENG